MNSIKIKDVAAKAGVSPSTVSRVLNNSQIVAPETREKVLKIIEEFSYVPNASAKNLRSRKTHTIGIIVPDVSVSYYSEIIKGAQDQALKRKYKLIICDTDNQAEREEEFFNLLLDKTVDGLIIVSPKMADDKLVPFIKNGSSIGIIGRSSKHPEIHTVITNNREFTYKAVQDLIHQGHKQIAFLSGFSYAIDSNERLIGYKEALSHHHIPFNSELIETGNFDEKLGYQAFIRLLKKGLHFSAVFAANDEMAFGVYKACRENNINIPNDLAIIGVDNDRKGEYISPSLTTVSQPKYDMGYKMTEMIIDDILKDESNDQKKSLTLLSEMIYRESFVPN